MIVLDLFSGLKGWSAPWNPAMNTILTADNVPAFGADYQGDLGDVGAFLSWLGDKGIDRADVILASPPCTSFSTMTMGKMWTHEGQPKHPTAVQGQRLVLATLRIIAALRPDYWIIENPRARLRSLPFLEGFERRTVTYCQYGEQRMKPTDLWGVFPPALKLKPACSNGDPCHIRSPRGSRNGTQGVGSAVAGLIPFKLANAVCLAITNEEEF